MRCAKIRLETGVIHCQLKTTEVLGLKYMCNLYFILLLNYV